MEIEKKGEGKRKEKKAIKVCLIILYVLNFCYGLNETIRTQSKQSVNKPSGVCLIFAVLHKVLLFTDAPSDMF